MGWGEKNDEKARHTARVSGLGSHLNSWDKVDKLEAERDEWKAAYDRERDARHQVEDALDTLKATLAAAHQQTDDLTDDLGEAEQDLYDMCKAFGEILAIIEALRGGS